jgi:ABC-type antimicrobial peptide transport system permease subunit
MPSIGGVRRCGGLLGIASGLSLVVGVFGIYPAVKASQINPIDALRYE